MEIEGTYAVRQRGDTPMGSAISSSIALRLGSKWNQPDCRAANNLTRIARDSENHLVQSS